MPRNFMLLILLSPGLFLAMSAGAASNSNDESHLAIELNYMNPDSARGVDGQGLGATFLYGNEFIDNWFLETRITGLVLERGDDGGTDFYQQDIGVDAVYRFGDNNDWRPFVLFGISAIRNDIDIEGGDDVGVGIHAGGGIVSGPLGSMNVRLRADLRYVHDDFLDGMQDVRAGIGVEIPLGGDRNRGAGITQVNTPTTTGDRDDDGVADYSDRCPNSLPYVKHDSDGCMLPNQTIRLYEVTFNNGTSILTPAARAELGALILALRGQPDLPIQIGGHTDAWGNPDENRQLSLERAEAVATHLVLQGVATQRLEVKGFGETRPVESNATAAGRERNRRIEITLLEQPAH